MTSFTYSQRYILEIKFFYYRTSAGKVASLVVPQRFIARALSETGAARNFALARRRHFRFALLTVGT